MLLFLYAAKTMLGYFGFVNTTIYRDSIRKKNTDFLLGDCLCIKKFLSGFSPYSLNHIRPLPSIKKEAADLKVRRRA
jgi:hypothetical protein